MSYNRKLSIWGRGSGRVVDGRKANYTYFRALARGGFTNDLGDSTVDALVDQDSRVHLERAGASHLCTELMLAKQASFLCALGDNTTTKTYGDRYINPHDHGIQMAVQAIIDGVNQTFDR